MMRSVSPWHHHLSKSESQLSSLDAELVFNLFEGFCGEPQTEALVPEVLSEIGIPYTGCSGTVLRLALDKARVKVMLKAAGIPTPDFQTTESSNTGYIPAQLSLYRQAPQ